jgi:segregation and condensation protein A
MSIIGTPQRINSQAVKRALLYLIKRQNLDILDIPIAEITRQYIEYVDLMKALRLELAAEYLVMAATLAEIKSRMLLPRPQAEPEEADPRAELVRRLQEYERFKRAAQGLDALPRVGRDVFGVAVEAPALVPVKKYPPARLDDLLRAFQTVVVRSERFSHHHVQREALSVRERMSRILAAVNQRPAVEFVELFTPEEGAMGVVVTLLAVLELAREVLIEVVQDRPFAPLQLKVAPGTWTEAR